MKKLFLTLIFVSTVFTADDLLSIYNEALERDPEFNSKKADLKISKEFRNQSISALLPRLNLSASTNWNEYYQERILQNDYNTFTYNLNFNQPLFRLDSWFTSRQAQKNYRAAEAQFAYQQQNLMIRVTRAYFNVLSARSLFKTRGANERTLENQFEEINDKFEAGAASRIELAEAKAALNRAISDRVLAEGNVDIAFEELNAIVGRELIHQSQASFQSLPDAIIACVGGGSNAIGIFHPFIDEDVRLIGVEAAGQGIDTGKHAAPLNDGEPGILHGAKSYLMQDSDGQIMATSSISAGLDYPGVGPEHSFLKDSGRAEYIAVDDESVMKAFHQLSELEGIIPALETAHAFAPLDLICSEFNEDQNIVINVSGRGDKDIASVAKLEGIDLE